MWWADMAKNIDAYQTWCKECAGRNKAQSISAYLRSSLMPVPFARLSWDLLEISPPGSGGEKGLLVIVCDYTHFTWLYSYYTKTAHEIAWFLYLTVLEAGVVPWSIRSDRGSEFRNEVIAEFAFCLGMLPV